MNQTVKTLLIVGAVGAVGYLVYREWKKRQSAVTATTVAPSVPSTNPQTNTGIAGQIGSVVSAGQDLANSLDTVGDALGIS